MAERTADFISLSLLFCIDLKQFLTQLILNAPHLALCCLPFLPALALDPHDLVKGGNQSLIGML